MAAAQKVIPLLKIEMEPPNKHGMVRATGHWMPYPPPPGFPPPPPPACFYETSLGSKVNCGRGYGAKAWATSTPSVADDGVGAQAWATGTPSMAYDGVGAQAWVNSTLSAADNRVSAQVEVFGTQSILGNSESRAQVVDLGSTV